MNQPLPHWGQLFYLFTELGGTLRAIPWSDALGLGRWAGLEAGGSAPAVVSACVLVTAGLGAPSIVSQWKLPEWKHE
jgi:hypothetical protein